MLPLILLNLAVIAIIVGVLLLLKKFIKSDKQIMILFIVLPLLTVACHYSSLLFHLIKDGQCVDYLKSNPNLILPIYPCNVVMWCLVILGFVWKKENKFKRFLIDYTFFFGVVSALVGMFANVDFVRNPNLGDYDILKGVLAHGFMLMNILALPFFGKVKIDLPVNMINIAISIAMMFVLGNYCNLVFFIIGPQDYAWDVNSMFILHCPFDGITFINFYFIAGVALPLYFGAFCLIELIVYKKGNRWIHRPFGWKIAKKEGGVE